MEVDLPTLHILILYFLDQVLDSISDVIVSSDYVVATPSLASLFLPSPSLYA